MIGTRSGCTKMLVHHGPYWRLSNATNDRATALHGACPECRKVKRYVTSPKLCLGEVEARARARLREGAFRDADLRASVTGPLPQSRLNASPATSPKQSLGEVTRLSLRHSGLSPWRACVPTNSTLKQQVNPPEVFNVHNAWLRGKEL